MQTKNSTRLLLLVIPLWLLNASAEPVLEQETITIKGRQGLPGTLYIAPWKRVGAPLESDELEGDIKPETEPLERDIFQRELELKRQGYSVD